MRAPTVPVLAAVVLVATGIVPGRLAGQADTTDAYRPGARLALLPIVFSSPDTRLALGVLPQYLFHTAASTRPSNLRADVYYTFNRQFNVRFAPSVWFPGNRWLMEGMLRYRRWPTDFFGVGPHSRGENLEEFTETLVHGSVDVLRHAGSGLYLGGRLAVRRARIGDIDPPGGTLALGTVPGTGSTRLAAAGIVAVYDTRDHVYLPTDGLLLKAGLDRYGSLGSGDRAFTLFQVDLRRYQSLSSSVTLAVQATATFGAGEVPFRLMPGLGERLRGYADTRYIDRQRWTVQAEIRAIPVWWRLGFAAFGGVGNVAGHVERWGSGGLKYAFGIGIRFLMYRKERITIREDIAFGRGSSGDYLDINEAF